MKKLRELQGGYPRHQDYLLSLQNELFAMSESMFTALGSDMVLRGCEVIDNLNGTVNIAAGIVYVGGEILRFDAVNNVSTNGSLAFIKSAAATTEPRVFGNGETKDIYSETKAIIGAKTSITQITVGTKLYNLKTYINDVIASYAIKGEIKDIYDLDNTFLNNFDASGLGVTARYSGWALFNGNNGAPNGQGRTRITVGSVITNGVQSDFAHGAAGGEVNHKLLITEMPKHKFEFRYKKGQADQNESGTSGSLIDVDLPHNRTQNTNELGGDQPHNIMQPYITVYTIIKIV